jgi:excisionase family DNA binding protein
MKKINLNDYITVKEAAEFLGVTSMTLRRWDESGKLIAKRHPINDYRLYLKKDLAKILKGIK